MSRVPMTLRSAVTAAVLLAIAAPAGAQNVETRYPAEQVSRDSRTLELGSAGTLEIKGVSGTITITTGSGTSARLDIERRARGVTDAEARRGLEEVTVAVDHSGARATVTTTVPTTERSRTQPPYRVDVNYTATVPRGTQLRLNNMSGDVHVTGVEGTLTVEVMSGDIQVRGTPRLQSLNTMSGDLTVTDVQGDRAVTLRTFSGQLTLERIRAPRLAADTMSGDVIARDVSAQETSLTTLSGDVDVSGPLPATGRYELRTHSGDVRLTLAGAAGVALEATSFSGDLDVPAEFRGREPAGTARSGRSRAVRGTIGDGGLRIVASSLTGDVTIVRK